jgi:hypothetical protein
MARLQIRLPTEFGTTNTGDTSPERDDGERSDAEPTDDRSRRLLRWHGCWAQRKP